jgi:hypothetical protein
MAYDTLIDRVHYNIGYFLFYQAANGAKKFNTFSQPFLISNEISVLHHVID